MQHLRYIFFGIFLFLDVLSSQAQERKNVVFIALDDLKPILGCYETEWIKSPNIDALAQSGTVFLNNHCQWAVCGPSRASLMLGMRPESTKVMDLKTNMREVNPEAKSLPQVFKENGYTTVARGKIYDPRCVPGGRDSDDPISWSLPYAPPKADTSKSKRVVDAPEVPPEALSDGQILKQGLECLNQVCKIQQPFFLAVGFKKPHLPFEAPKSFWDLYDRSKIPLTLYPGKAKGEHEKYSYHNSSEPRTYEGVPPEGDFDENLQRELLHGYAACVSYVDSLIGKFIQALKDKGVYEDTIICLWGDHGFHLGDHNMWGKHSNLEQATRSPLIIHAPGYPNAQRTNSPTEFIDIYPTLLDLCGLDAPQNLQGKSLKPLLLNPKDAVKKGAISNFKQAGALGYAYRTEQHRYVEWINQKSQQIMARELYDYKSDPGELVNLITDKSYAELAKSLAKDLRDEAKGCRMLYNAK